jgi:hypothetical protein
MNEPARKGAIPLDKRAPVSVAEPPAPLLKPETAPQPAPQPAPTEPPLPPDTDPVYYNTVMTFLAFLMTQARAGNMKALAVSWVNQHHVPQHGFAVSPFTPFVIQAGVHTLAKVVDDFAVKEVETYQQQMNETSKQAAEQERAPKN